MPLHLWSQVDLSVVRARVEHEMKSAKLQQLGDMDGAIMQLRSAQRTCRDTGVYALRIAELFRLRGDTSIMLDHLELGLRTGWNLDQIMHDGSAFQEILRSAPCSVQVRLYEVAAAARRDRLQRHCEVDLLGEIDQWARHNFDKSLIRMQDSINYVRLEALTKENGRYIPSPGSLLVLIHSLDSESRLEFFGPLLGQALIDGDIDSESYANIIDRNASLSGNDQIYGTDNVIDVKVAELPMSRFNKARVSIGLPPFQ